ncbi:AAA family ATPase, partial [Vibrio vulnificus]|nr:AAA family ATPase [Vibrio vulnificus]
MLKSIQVNNFKSLDFSDSVDVSSMSIFCGANSSGKSSFLQAILLLAQTSDTRFNGSSMLLNGRLVKLGGFNDIVSFSKDNELIRLKADIEGDDELDINRVIISVEFGFGHEISETQREQITPP